MQIVIDIDEETFIKVKQHGIITDRTVVNAIANGVPLPKGRGRLVDADELKADIHMNKRNRYATQRDVDYTIIEADKEVYHD